MKTVCNSVVSLFVCILCFSTAGCGALIVGGAVAAGGAGTYLYMDGQAKATYSTSLDNAYTASLAACKEMGITVTEKNKQGASAKIVGKFSGDTTTLSLRLVGDNITEITVRVGLWGNEESSHRIQKAITSRL